MLQHLKKMSLKSCRFLQNVRQLNWLIVCEHWERLNNKNDESVKYTFLLFKLQYKMACHLTSKPGVIACHVPEDKMTLPKKHVSLSFVPGFQGTFTVYWFRSEKFSAMV